MVNSTVTSKSNRFSALEQAPDTPQVASRARHPYARCQCEGDDCVECLREQIESLKEELRERDETLETVHQIAAKALRIRKIRYEDIEYLAGLYHPDISRN